MKRTILISFTISALAFIGGLCLGKDQDEPSPMGVTEIQKPLDSWQLLELAIIKTESDFNAQAIGTKNDIGVFQITPIYVKEVNRILDTLKYSHVDAFDIEKSLEMFEVYQSVKNPDRDIEKAINLHNPNGASIDYATKVLSNYRYLVRMEEVRNAITKQ